MRILLIEDEQAWADEARRAIAGLDDAELHHEADGAGGLARGLSEAFDVLIIDRVIHTDASDGLAILARLRDSGVEAPAIILSSLGDVERRIEGLDAGADDYLAKPFDAGELRARLKALSRRFEAASSPQVLLRGRLEVRVKARTAHWAGAHIALSPQEFEILALLAEFDGEIVDRSVLWRRVWRDFPNLPPQTNVIDVAMARLRRAVVTTAGEDPVETVRGKGWRLRSEL